jgi:hypothetical protein
MKHTIKISGVIIGMALAMTVAYARTEERSGQSPAQRDASMRTSQIAIPPALRLPALIQSCTDPDGGFCTTLQICLSDRGHPISVPPCTALKEICCRS